MIKEEKSIDFYTTGRQPSKDDFVRISEWIKRSKNKRVNKQQLESSIKKKMKSNSSKAKHKTAF